MQPVPLAEAARRLGISADAVGTRPRRGTPDWQPPIRAVTAKGTRLVVLTHPDLPLRPVYVLRRVAAARGERWVADGAPVGWVDPDLGEPVEERAQALAAAAGY